MFRPKISPVHAYIGMMLFPVFGRQWFFVCNLFLFSAIGTLAVSVKEDSPAGTTVVEANDIQVESSPLGFPIEWSDIWVRDRWSLNLGVAMITSNVINDFLKADVNRASGEPGGEIYFIGGSYTLTDLSWHFKNHTFTPQLEVPLVLGIVNENDRSPYMDYNVGITLRWNNFPWNETVYTTLESGVGLSYSERVVRIEEFRHAGRARSHLKFYWPITLSLASPQYPQHQLTFFLHHQSGGHVFDRGGSNHLGIGYRYLFRKDPPR